MIVSDLFYMKCVMRIVKYINIEVYVLLMLILVYKMLDIEILFFFKELFLYIGYVIFLLLKVLKGD